MLLRHSVRVSSAVSVAELDVPELVDVVLVDELVDDDDVVDEFDASLCASVLSHCTPMGIVFLILGRLLRAWVVATEAGVGGLSGDPGGSATVPFPVRSMTVASTSISGAVSWEGKVPISCLVTSCSCLVCLIGLGVGAGAVADPTGSIVHVDVLFLR